MKSYLGQYQSATQEPLECTIRVFDKSIHVGYREENGTVTTEVWDIGAVDASYQLSLQATQIRKLNQRHNYVLIPGKEAANIIKLLQDEQLKPWYKKNTARAWAKNLLVLTGVFVFFIALYFLLVPWLSEKLAGTVSVSTEEQFGETIYNSLDVELEKDSIASIAVSEFFARMEIPSEYRVKISVVRGAVVNAFALPGGRIVIYDALLKQMETYPELAALLSHEYTHVKNKHVTKSIFRKLGSKIFLSMLFGNLGSVTGVLADQADDLKSLTYSRSLEKEADLDGLAILMERKIDPRGFAELFRHLQAAAPVSGTPELLASHPDINKRSEYIREKAATAVVEEHEPLRNIFDEIKQKIKQ